MFNELTEVDIKKMQEEIEYRNTVLRQKIHEDIVAAKELGDLSENAEYRYARREKAKNEGRIDYLKGMINSAIIIKPNSDSNIVGIFDIVELFFEEDNETDTYTIATTLRRDAAKNIISNISPLGKEIMGKKVGDRLEIVVSPTYKYYVTIKSIKKGKDDDSLPIAKY